MTDFNGYCAIKRMASFYLYLILMTLLCLTAAGCSGNNDNSKNHNTRSGDLNFQLSWHSGGASSTSRQAPPERDICVDFLISRVNIRLKNASGQFVMSTGLKPCSDHSANLKNIPPQSGYTVEAEGYIGDSVRWFGKKEGVTVTANQSAAPIVVDMHFTGAASDPPSATISPVDAAINVPTDTPITVLFDKAVVASSVHEESILITNDTDPVPGEITYNADTFEAVFQPQQELDVSTRYTATVTTDVIDQNGQPMASEVISRFSTPNVWYVDSSSAASGTGQSWAEAFRTISEAVTAGGDNDHIWVKHGTYRLSGDGIVDKPLKLVGGFRGTETLVRQRDISTWETVIDGNGQHRCFRFFADAALDGFTITNGSGSGRGGAILIDNASPRIMNCRIIDNTSNHSVVYNDQGGPSFSGCIFKNNEVDRPEDDLAYGALAHESAKEDIYITNCRFENNSSNHSGASISALRCEQLWISGCVFKNNYSSEVGAAIDGWESNFNISNSTFYGNRVYPRDKDRFAAGAAVKLSHGSSDINHCTFAFNKTLGGTLESNDNLTQGGAISGSFNCEVYISNSILWGNRAEFGPQVFDDETSTISFYACNIEPGQALGTTDDVIQQDPRFGPDLRLRSDSPCIDAALPIGFNEAMLDMDGENRPVEGNERDMGVDEFIDSDNDHMPDYWETLHGVSTAENDEDSDQLPNLSEYHLGTDPNIAQGLLNATLRGALREDGFHQASDRSTPTGTSGGQGHRSFFIFDVADAPVVGAAAVRLELADIADTGAVLAYLRGSSTNASALSADTSGQSGIDIYNDLGNGVLYGFYGPTSAEKDTVLDIQLNQAAVDAINTARAGSGKFIIGLSLPSDATDEHLSFSSANEVRTHQLVLMESRE